MWPISQSFRAELLSPNPTVAVKAEVLNTDLNPVEGGVFYSRNLTNEFQNLIIDGSVDVDVDRGTRRTFQLSVLNENGEFSPGSKWSGMFYVNRAIRLWRGVILNNGEMEFVPIGTFLIDRAEVTVERNMSTVQLSGSDMWKKLAKADSPRNRLWEEGTNINAIIRDLANECGVTRLNLDPLSDRNPNGREINWKFQIERKENKGERLWRMCRKYGVEIYFNPMGVLTTNDFREPLGRGVDWAYDPRENHMMVSLRRSFTDDNLYNHYVCLATGGKHTYMAQKRDDDPKSPTCIDRIGDRVKILEFPDLKTQDAADHNVKLNFYKVFALNEEITLEAICNPALEGNDVVVVAEPTFANLDRQRYLVRSVNIPLSSFKQTIHLKRLINVA